jgi:Gpi18-like mannosyltransferase
MKRTVLKRFQKSIIVIGLFIAITGLGLHLSTPGTTRSGFPVNVEPMGTTIENLQFQNADGYGFGIELMGPEQIDFDDTTAHLLTAAQYSDYLSGTPINETGTLISLLNGGRDSFEMVLTDDLDFYLVFTNDGNETVPWSYYYYILPASFYPTFAIAFSGAFIIIVGFALYFDGWKRWFLTGLGIQSLLFLVRVFTLSTYSLGLPSIFWDLIHTELYNDYQYFYLSWIPTLWEGAWAYSADLAVYLYPPLWIYTVGILGSTPSWLPGLVLFTFNAATGVLVYKIVNRLTDDDTRAKIAMMIYMLNPLTLFYGAFMWLNPTPFVFFMTLSFYLALTQREEYAIVAIAIATLYKQFAVVFFPILVILFIKRKANLRIKGKLVVFLKHTAIYVGLVGLVSLPYLIVSLTEFLNQMIFWNTGNFQRLRVFIPENWMTVHANTFFLWLGFPTWFTDFIASLIINYVFLIMCGVLVYGGFSFLGLEEDNEDERFRTLFMKAILWGFIAVMSIQLFYPRGSYKFYLLALAPLAALLFDYKDLELSQKTPFKIQKHHLFTILMTWVVFLCYRFVYFWFLGAWVLFYLIMSGELKRIVNGSYRFLKPKEPGLSELEEIYSE